MFVGVVFFVAGVFYAIENASDKFKFSVLPSEVPMKLPKDASDVDYRWSWGGSRYTADFNISETGFLNWMKEMGLLNRTNRFTTYDNNHGTYWAEVHAPPFPKYLGLGYSDKGSVPPLRIEADDVRKYPNPSVVRVIIKNGYYHDDYNTEGFDDSGRTIIFDSDSGRAYCRISRF